MNKKMQYDLFNGYCRLQSKVSLLKIQLEDYQQQLADLNRSSNRGSLDMVKLKRLVSGLKNSNYLDLVTSLRDASLEYIECLQAQTDGRNEVERTKV